MQSSLIEKGISKKNRCKDCNMCQGCSESRCKVCIASKCNEKKTKRSISEQIELYNTLNPGLTPRP
jgi:hypothetical protein